ncbi:MAG: FGGY family carbohydrate kinase [Chloroflexi bacterium]|nr:FGGY family carbohydrate kinase [Chloroflexota bacterium]
MARLLGLDAGSSALKALLYDTEMRRVCGIAQHPTPVLQHANGMSEFDPEALWIGICHAIRACCAQADDRPVDGIAVASMGEAGIPLSDAGEVCYPAITWYDRRTQSYVPWWEAHVGGKRIFTISGQLLHPMFGALKMQWLRDHAPGAWQRTAHWLSIADYVIFRLTDALVTDYSLASRTMLFDQQLATWSDELLSAAGFSAALLPVPLPSGRIAGNVTATAAGITGLSMGTPVVTGGHDHLVGCLSAQAAQPGIALDSAGTAESVLLTTPTYNPSDRLRDAGFSTYRHVLPEHYVVVGGQHGSGGLINWILDTVYGCDEERPYAMAFREAEAIPVGCDGLLCLPHLRGSRVPHHDLQSRAAFVGLVDGHTRAHLVRSALEALSLWLRSTLEVLESVLPTSIGSVVVIGGATRSPLWIRIKADATRRRLRIPDVPEAVALGAALLAGTGIGAFSTALDASLSLQLPLIDIRPDDQAAILYDRLYLLHEQLYPALRDINRGLAAFADTARA